MYTGEQYAKKFKSTIDNIGESVTVSYKKRDGYNPIKGESSSVVQEENFKMLIRKTDRSDYEQLPEGLRNKDVRKIFFYKELPYKDVTITRSNGKEYKIITPPIDNLFNGANIYYFCFIALKEVQ